MCRVERIEKTSRTVIKKRHKKSKNFVRKILMNKNLQIKPIVTNLVPKKFTYSVFKVDVAR